MSNILDLKTFTDNQKIWSDRLLKAVDDKKVIRYFTGQKDKEQKDLSWSFYGLFDTDNLRGYVVIVADFKKKTWIAIKESEILYPHMEDRVWGPDISDTGTAESLSEIMWGYIKIEIKNDLEKEIMDNLPKHQGA